MFLKRYKFELAVLVILIVSFIVLRNLFLSMKTDHSLDLAKQELKLLKENRQEVIKEREAWLVVVNQQNEQIRILNQRDSVMQENFLVMNEQIKFLQTKYNENIKKINTYSPNELLDYIRNLPKFPDNDY